VKGGGQGGTGTRGGRRREVRFGGGGVRRGIERNGDLVE